MRHAALTPAVAELYVDGYVVGQKYLVPTIRNIAERPLSTVLEAASKTDRHAAVFAHLVRYVYITHQDAATGLRNLLVLHFTGKVAGMSEDDEWKALLRAVPEFALEVTDALIKQKAQLVAELDVERPKRKKPSLDELMLVGVQPRNQRRQLD